MSSPMSSPTSSRMSATAAAARGSTPAPPPAARPPVRASSGPPPSSAPAEAAAGAVVSAAGAATSAPSPAPSPALHKMQPVQRLLAKAASSAPHPHASHAATNPSEHHHHHHGHHDQFSYQQQHHGQQQRRQHGNVAGTSPADADPDADAAAHTHTHTPAHTSTPTLTPAAQAALSMHNRSKRSQVKRACVNCQRACKKCDDGRPCGRCTRLGLELSCADSARKERARLPSKKHQPPPAPTPVHQQPAQEPPRQQSSPPPPLGQAPASLPLVSLPLAQAPAMPAVGAAVYAATAAQSSAQYAGSAVSAQVPALPLDSSSSVGLELPHADSPTAAAPAPLPIARDTLAPIHQASRHLSLPPGSADQPAGSQHPQHPTPKPSVSHNYSSSLLPPFSGANLPPQSDCNQKRSHDDKEEDVEISVHSAAAIHDVLSSLPRHDAQQQYQPHTFAAMPVATNSSSSSNNNNDLRCTNGAMDVDVPQDTLSETARHLPRVSLSRFTEFGHHRSASGASAFSVLSNNATADHDLESDTADVSSTGPQIAPLQSSHRRTRTSQGNAGSSNGHLVAHGMAPRVRTMDLDRRLSGPSSATFPGMDQSPSRLLEADPWRYDPSRAPAVCDGNNDTGGHLVGCSCDRSADTVHSATSSGGDAGTYDDRKLGRINSEKRRRTLSKLDILSRLCDVVLTKSPTADAVEEPAVSRSSVPRLNLQRNFQDSAAPTSGENGMRSGSGVAQPSLPPRIPSIQAASDAPAMAASRQQPYAALPGTLTWVSARDDPRDVTDFEIPPVHVHAPVREYVRPDPSGSPSTSGPPPSILSNPSATPGAAVHEALVSSSTGVSRSVETQTDDYLLDALISSRVAALVATSARANATGAVELSPSSRQYRYKTEPGLVDMRPSVSRQDRASNPRAWFGDFDDRGADHAAVVYGVPAMEVDSALHMPSNGRWASGRRPSLASSESSTTSVPGSTSSIMTMSRAEMVTAPPDTAQYVLPASASLAAAPIDSVGMGAQQQLRSSLSQQSCSMPMDATTMVASHVPASSVLTPPLSSASVLSAALPPSVPVSSHDSTSSAHAIKTAGAQALESFHYHQLRADPGATTLSPAAGMDCQRSDAHDRNVQYHNHAKPLQEPQQSHSQCHPMKHVRSQLLATKSASDAQPEFKPLPLSQQQTLPSIYRSDTLPPRMGSP
ncbi:hypothetical protein BC831DRAFT_441272 [Entophlyctis helioformis]|nr:hypothetical protein BC831DRAFT_441272 [Entophlyctis helioformis]